MHAGWYEWREGTGVMCDTRISARMKEKGFQRASGLYGFEMVSVEERKTGGKSSGHFGGKPRVTVHIR